MSAPEGESSPTQEAEALPRVLLVDDEQNVLDGLRRKLAMDYDVTIANSGFAGLRTLRDQGPFAVVVSDMQMPRMNGAWFLSRVKENWPRTTRVLLTGHADLPSAMEAVNRGKIYEFLTKPCKDDRLREVLAAAVDQHRVLEHEARLLEETVARSIEMLAQVLEMVNPVAFSRAERVARILEVVCRRLDIPDAWRVVTAGRLSQLGCVGLQPELLAKLHIGEPLDAVEHAAYAEHPDIGRGLIEKIPRLEEVAAIIGGQLKDPEASSDGVDDGMIQLGSNLLRAALIFEQGRLRGVTSTEMIAELKELGYASEIQAAFRGISLVAEEGAERIVQIADLNVYMELSQDVRSTTGSMLAAKGQRVTAAMLARFLNFQRADKLRGPVRVVMLSSDDGGKPEVAESSGTSPEPQE